MEGKVKLLLDYGAHDEYSIRFYPEVGILAHSTSYTTYEWDFGVHDDKAHRDGKRLYFHAIGDSDESIFDGEKGLIFAEADGGSEFNFFLADITSNSWKVPTHLNLSDNKIAKNDAGNIVITIQSKFKDPVNFADTYTSTDSVNVVGGTCFEGEIGNDSNPLIT